MSKKIKIKGKCPRCGSKLEIGSLCYEFSYMDEPEVTELLPICTNDNCDESCDMVVKSDIDGSTIGQ